MNQIVQKLRAALPAALAVLLVLVAAQPASAAPRRERQWYLDYLRIDAVHKISTGQGIVVAVVDTGVDAGHPDLAGQVLPGLTTDGSSGDGRTDEDGHGTHMAGIIAARNRGVDGVLGVAPGVKILPIRAAKGEEAGAIPVANGIRAAADAGAKVINVSAAGFQSGQEIEAVKYALSKDAVIVASAGNLARGHRSIMTPANIPGVIAVTGLNQRGSFWSGSAQGPEAVVSAPAERILSTNTRTGGRSGYGTGDGTSDASAIVSGVAALIRAKYPDLDAANVINRIIKTADDAGPPGRDPQYGFGKINALRALTAGLPTVAANPLVKEAATPSAVPGGTTGENHEFDVADYGDRSGLTDQQVMIIGIAIAVLLFILLILAVWLLLRWRRNRARALLPAGHPGPSGVPPPGYGPPPGGYGGLPASAPDGQGGPPPPAGHPR
ncbi:MAG TPA: type VII secretion-associated serine protease mycosin [Micromonosporaceae bacterium]|nr:type VII secretion-associated serine protease mycosin [Micromonosporaceae bacterium]